MTAYLCIDGEWSGRWMDFGGLEYVRTENGGIYYLLRAVIPGWRVGVRLYSRYLRPGDRFPEGLVLPGVVVGRRPEGCKIHPQTGQNHPQLTVT